MLNILGKQGIFWPRNFLTELGKGLTDPEIALTEPKNGLIQKTFYMKSESVKFPNGNPELRHYSI